MHFSARTNWDLGQNDFSLAVDRARAGGGKLFDLTISNPTACGFEYDGALLTVPLSLSTGLRYNPDALGMASSRKAVHNYYRDAGASVSIEHICLTTSTSEAYGFLFKMLCDPGDQIHIARPSYPLLDYVARLEDVVLREYPLLYDPGCTSADSDGWTIDLHALEASITPKSRAIIVVHPNNPTGNFVSAGERDSLFSLCERYGLALIADEVFLDYSLSSPKPQSFAAASRNALCFVLSGVSKVCGLPQMKVSWIAACGPEGLLREVMPRLELIADTYLSMNAPIQLALPAWLEGRSHIQQQILQRMRVNLGALDERLKGSSAQLLPMQGGWTAVLRVPRSVGGKPFVFAALDSGVLVQPGEFYGLPEGRAVLSLLTPTDVWRDGLERLPVE